ncbi:MAG TPA: Asp-tRNA(Asn)/Glu-tRNA(Gln) amidotransferase subunit GatC [Clostridiaceae bacterium]|nr:Asp-tRNA(Asn)/Glu-tRNA(Gln) amidotransferase subunit GatC [Clostridiaceae bacterium]
MNITIDDIKYIAKLAKLRFSEEEVLKLTSEFESILAHFKSIDKMNLDNVDLNQYSSDNKTITRPDVVKNYEDKSKLFQNVKSKRDTFIVIPKIIE